MVYFTLKKIILNIYHNFELLILQITIFVKDQLILNRNIKCTLIYLNLF